MSSSSSNSNKRQQQSHGSSSSGGEQATSAPSSPKLTMSRSPSPSSLSFGPVDCGSPMGLGDADPYILESFKPIETNMSYEVPTDRAYPINTPPQDRPVRL
ncbi:hypothetical protein GGI04_005481, partial [Coemansia thaxteri]